MASAAAPFIGEEHPPGSPDGHTRHARQPASPALHGARRTAATNGRRPQTPTGGRLPLTDRRPPPAPPTGGRHAHRRRAAAEHAADGRPRPTPTTGCSRPTPTTAGSRQKSARAPLASTRAWPGRPPSAYRHGSHAHERRGRGAEGRSDAGKGTGGRGRRRLSTVPTKREKKHAPESIPENGTTAYRRPLGSGPPRKMRAQRKCAHDREPRRRRRRLHSSHGTVHQSACTASQKQDATAHSDNNQRARMGTLHHGGNSTHPLRDTRQGVARAGPHPILSGG